jgi:hypothetical protein
MAAEHLTHWTGNGAVWPEPGQTYRDPAGGAVILILTGPRWPGVLRCGGVPMVTSRPLPCGYHGRRCIGFSTALWPGRRYRDPAGGLEVRCLRAGSGHLSYAGQPLTAA